MSELTVGCVMVVANGERYLREQLDSMVAQTRSLAEIVVVDDHSRDESLNIIHDVLPSKDPGIRVITAPKTPPRLSLYSRIANNFAAGVAVSTTDVILLADQDDVWMPSRVERQAAAFEKDPCCALLAGNGNLIDHESADVGHTLRDAFPAPDDWDRLNQRDRQRYVLHNPVATGAACAMRRSRMPGRGGVPRGWLHDRWYSLEASYSGGLRFDDEPVMRYRQHDSQVIGTSGAKLTSVARVRNWIAVPGLAAKKLGDLSRLAWSERSGFIDVLEFAHDVSMIGSDAPKERARG